MKHDKHILYAGELPCTLGRAQIEDGSRLAGNDMRYTAQGGCQNELQRRHGYTNMRLIKSLFGRKSIPSAKPSESRQIGRPEVTPQAWLIELFKRHGLVSTIDDGWVLPNAELPAIRGIWHPGQTHGRLDMQVLLRDGVIIEECFAGIGVGDTGLADGLHNFTINSFHVLLSALWSCHDPEQTQIEAWTVAGRPFSAFIGNVGSRSSIGVSPTIPADLMPQVEAAIRSEPLEHDLHWFRIYVGHVSGDFTFEALKDNEPWPAGASALGGLGWTTCDAFYSARLFIVLRATVYEAPAKA